MVDIRKTSQPAPLQPLKKRRGLARMLTTTAMVVMMIGLAWWWFFWRVHVEPGETLRLTVALGSENPDAATNRVIPETAKLKGVKGVQEQVYGEGYHFFNPIFYDTQIDTRHRWLHEINPGEIAVVTSQSGKQPEDADQFIVKKPGYKGVLQHVLTPGRWRINEEAFKVEKKPATIVEPGYVGVVTSQTGVRSAEELAGDNEMGVRKTVLQPGIYYLNPVEYKVNIIEIGFRQKTIMDISFPSKDGYQIKCDITVIWGIEPQNAPYIVKHVGSTDVEIERRVINQVVQSSSRNQGATLSASELVKGEMRQAFIDRFTTALKKECESHRITILQGLVRKIEIPIDIRSPIQNVQIQQEKKKTLEDQELTQNERNKLETVKGEVAKTITVTKAETDKMVAEEREKGLKVAAEIRAKTERDVAEILAKVADVDAAIDREKGAGEAHVTKVTNEAEADRFTQIVKAFGSPEAYTRYTFAMGLPENFTVVLRYSGEGTFWTDLPKEFKSLETAAAMKILEKSQKKK